jgi:hypothetical protein
LRQVGQAALVPSAAMFADVDHYIDIAALVLAGIAQKDLLAPVAVFISHACDNPIMVGHLHAIYHRKS